MYESLDLNNPKGLSLYKGYPIPKDYKEYMTQEENLAYLHGFADKYNVKSFTSLNSYVNSVRLVQNLTDEEIQDIPLKLTKRFVVEVVSYHDFEKDVRHF